MNKETIKYRTYNTYDESRGELDLLGKFNLITSIVQSWEYENDTIADAMEATIRDFMPSSNEEVKASAERIKDFIDTLIEHGKIYEDDFRSAIFRYHIQAFEANIEELIFNCTLNMMNKMECCSDIHMSEYDFEEMVDFINRQRCWKYGDIKDAIETYINEIYLNPRF